MFAWGSKDRRTYERVKILVPCRLEVAGELLLGKTQDVSLGGVCFEVALGPGVPKKIRNQLGQIRLILPEGEFVSDCAIIRASSSAVALKFKNLSGTRAETFLRSFLETQVTYLTKLSRLG
ncbi:MAG: PilZ domain-containing protein [Myxococcota bacterium]|nr:PilZ domain-containing protein [Myxococcota bacterium]